VVSGHELNIIAIQKRSNRYRRSEDTTNKIKYPSKSFKLNERWRGASLYQGHKKITARKVRFRRRPRVTMSKPEEVDNLGKEQPDPSWP